MSECLLGFMGYVSKMVLQKTLPTVWFGWSISAYSSPASATFYFYKSFEEKFWDNLLYQNNLLRAIWSSSPSSCKQHVVRCQNIVLWRGYNHRSMRRKSLLLWWSSITCGKLPGMSFTLNVRFLNKSSWTSLSSYPYHLLRCLLSSSRISCKEILRWY